MADLLSISASVAGLITIADTAFRRTFKYIKAVKDAPKRNPPSSSGQNNAQQTAALLRHWAKVDSADKGVVEEIQALASDADHSATPKGLARPDFASVPSRTIATDSCSSLRIAAEFGHLSIVRNIIQDDIHEIDAVDKSTGRTSLHYAAKAGHVEIVQQLLERGADCNARDKKGKTALHYFEEQYESRNWLLDKNNSSKPVLSREIAPLNEAHDMGTDTGLTPLHVAVDACALEAVRCLADDGADVNAVMADGSTVLHCLVSSKSRILSCEVVESLLAKGADPCKSRAEGRTTLHVLTEWDNHFEETRLPVLQRLEVASRGAIHEGSEIAHRY
ncbi:hypothetical protein HO133_009002 [Letharia lupina]|uniref:Ankyrin repeat protein n=1 Tax=Letharia lupina TaxID=560253 RepID=A0A8H6CMU7_9LECA|nr:uncharacterized protein HO133_009002 [Letharia lupina]KAF6226136.1 hypothetical protein HO133_009002 [Letharia lupina]